MIIIPTEDLNEFNGLPAALKDRIRQRLQVFDRISDLISGGMSQAKALRTVASSAPGMAHASLKRHYPLWLRSGRSWRTLTDARHEPAPSASRDLTDWCRALRARFKRATGGTAAYREAMRLLASGDPVPGLGTWRDIWRRENPGVPSPDLCPYSTAPGSQPNRLSARNFARLCHLPKAQRSLALSGTAAARMDLSQLVGFDTSTLKPLELIAFDDVRTDWMVADPETKKVVELWLLVAMDIATRCIIRFGARPRRERADGTKTGLTRRDMQHLVCGIYREYGLPQGYTSTLLVENASAAITSGFEAALSEASGGIIRVKRTSILSGNPFHEAFSENGQGNPHAKAWLESLHNYFHNEGSGMPGQIGSHYSLKPQNHENALRHTERLMKTAEPVLTLTDRMLHNIPFRTLEQAGPDLEDLFIRINNRREHALLDFEIVPDWRWNGQPTWNAWPPPQDLPRAAFAQIETRHRPESPWMRLQRLAAPLKFSPLPASTIPQLLMDQAACTYHGAGVLVFRHQNKRYGWYVADLRLAEGDQLVAWWNADRPQDGISLTNGKGQYVGQAEPTLRAHPLEEQSLSAITKRKQQVFARDAQELRSSVLTYPVLEARDARADEDLATLDLARAALPAPAPDAPDKTAHVAARRPRKVTAPALSPGAILASMANKSNP